MMVSFPWPSKNHSDEKCEVYLDGDTVRIDVVAAGIQRGRRNHAIFQRDELPKIIDALCKMQAALDRRP
jgi:hypothetical protein